MALKPGDAANFETLKRAAANGALALMECRDAKTGEYRAVICAVHMENSETVMTPLGHLCVGNPYEDYVPPEPVETEPPLDPEDRSEDIDCGYGDQ